ncbi:MAG: 23S rRNA (pseudouridine(1915)-N(3))-methyltransferase RlmH [Bacilli bacterium]|nr:23S rRNA (pseudouridine(1915)-N(3))-methyltransferase RlmH [Bacilli bacterium]MCI9434318.1 23S rRNA (pseudouridine(1915)-N(3))-methyltransferase RlmH [Bacilli bacterium]
MIKILCVGKIKEKYLKDAIIEYQKRISKYTKLEIIEVEDIFEQNISDIKKKEATLLEKYISPKDYVITLEIEGKQLDSIELSKKMSDILIINSNIVFIIGGSYGIDMRIKQRSNYALSFSKLTFPHQLFRVLLLEQVYRAYKILNNESYHK